MPYTSDPYTKTVCACLRYATAKEKAAVQAELEAHIEDHTEALLAAGYNAGHAQRLAVEAMGDPQDVGQALNEAFPRRWWVLSAWRPLLWWLRWCCWFCISLRPSARSKTIARPSMIPCPSTGTWTACRS